jgi:hypothetical protein
MSDPVVAYFKAPRARIDDLTSDVHSESLVPRRETPAIAAERALTCRWSRVLGDLDQRSCVRMCASPKPGALCSGCAKDVDRGGALPCRRNDLSRLAARAAHVGFGSSIQRIPSGGIVAERVACGSALAPINQRLSDGFTYSGRSCPGQISLRRHIVSYGALIDLGLALAVVVLIRRRPEGPDIANAAPRMGDTKPLAGIP